LFTPEVTYVASHAAEMENERMTMAAWGGPPPPGQKKNAEATAMHITPLSSAEYAMLQPSSLLPLLYQRGFSHPKAEGQDDDDNGDSNGRRGGRRVESRV